MVWESKVSLPGQPALAPPAAPALGAGNGHVREPRRKGQWEKPTSPDLMRDGSGEGGRKAEEDRELWSGKNDPNLEVGKRGAECSLKATKKGCLPGRPRITLFPRGCFDFAVGY